MNGLKILIVDDESRMRKLLHDYLEASGVQILEAADGQAGLDIFMGVKGIDVVILDVMMPKMDGWQVCTEIRKVSNVPVIMLTARGEERDELKGFELGVDEYISKPFSPRILAARIEALVRRGKGQKNAQTIFAGDLTVDREGRKVAVAGRPVELSYKEYELLNYLIDNAGIALSREKILNQVWDYDYYGDTRTIDTHIKKLRQKLGASGDCIETVRNIGYKFEAAQDGSLRLGALQGAGPQDKAAQDGAVWGGVAEPQGEATLGEAVQDGAARGGAAEPQSTEPQGGAAQGRAAEPHNDTAQAGSPR